MIPSRSAGLFGTMAVTRTSLAAYSSVMPMPSNP